MRIHPIAVFVFACLSVSTLWAQPLGTAFTYQGRLKNGGSPADGSFNMDFKLYSVATGGAPLASQSLPGVSVSDGLFTVQVDFGPGMFDGNQRWLEVIVNGSTLVPRQPLTAEPHALLAANADRLDGLDSTAFLTAVPNPLTLSGSNGSHIIRGENASLSAGSTAVSGISTATSGQIYGGDFRSSSPAGFGVYGSGGVGIFGDSFSTTGGGFGGYFQSPSTSGTGVFGQATALTGITYGGRFETQSTDGRGLLGIAHTLTGDNIGVFGQSNSTSGRGVNGLATAATGINFGVIGESHSAVGRGVFGVAHASTGINFGVMGQSNSTAGYGVYSVGNMHATGVISGNASGLTNFPVPFSLTGSGAYVFSAQNTSTDSGSAVQGLATAATGTTIGGRFESASDEGVGVAGLATTNSANGYTSGVLGQATSSIGRGVYGRATSSSGDSYGVWGESDSNSGTGVYGKATRLSGVTYGVRGISLSSTGTGVSGNAVRTGTEGLASSPTGFGVSGYATSTTGVNIGVYGATSSSAGWGVYSFGDMGATGTKSFCIDHPFDPENKFLLHYAAESPMPQNFYLGNIVTDARGYAWVELPDYFGEINTNFKYQLTVISEGADFVQVMISRKLKDNRFQVRTSAPNIEVSWRVDADRNDLYVRNRPHKDVVDKEGPSKGMYQYPEFYGQPPEKGMNYDATLQNIDPARPVSAMPTESVFGEALEADEMPR